MEITNYQMASKFFESDDEDKNSSDDDAVNDVDIDLYYQAVKNNILNYKNDGKNSLETLFIGSEIYKANENE